MLRPFLPMIVIALAATRAQAGVILSDTFSYPDGPVQVVSNQKWVGHSGTTTNQVDVAANELALTDAESQDVNAPLDGQPYSPGGTDVLYASFKIVFTAAPSAGGSYFAHFKDNATGFRCRVWSLATNLPGGQFRIGLSSATSSAPTAMLPNELSLNTPFTIVVRLSVSDAVSTVWINPTSESDTGATTEAGTGLNATSFAFRQNAGIGTMRIDNLLVGTAFAEVVSSGIQPPSIDVQPSDLTVTAGDDASFKVAVSGTPPLTYRWFLNDAPITGSGSTLSLTTVGVAQAGGYLAVISNSAGSVTSRVATLTVNSAPIPPTISLDPQSQTVLAGAGVTFSVEVAGSLPLMYQWLFNGTNIASATNATLQLNSVTPSSAGSYTAFVTNRAGSALSQPAILTVEVPNPAVVTNIAYLHTLLDPFDYFVTDTTTLFTVEGIVTTYTSITVPASALFYIQDATAGIAVFWNGGGSSVPKAGDLVRVTGPLTQFNGLLELGPNTNNAAHSVKVLSSGHPLPAPKLLEFSMQNDPLAMEALEGSYVVVSNVFIDVSTASFATGNVTLTNSLDETFVLRVDARTDLIGQARPSGPVTVFGVLGQFDSSRPLASFYQLTPTRFADIVSAAKAPSVRFTNILSNLVRPGDQLTNGFAEHALRPGETITVNIVASDPNGKAITLTPVTAGLPPSAIWTLPSLTGTNLTGSFTFTASHSDAGSNYVVRLQASNDIAVNNATWQIYVPTVQEQHVIVGEFLANPDVVSAPQFNPLLRDPALPAVTSDDEYVELVNLSASEIDLVNWTIADSVQMRHRFYETFSMSSSNAVIVYGGPLNGSRPVLDVPTIPASENAFGFGLNNTGGDSIIVRNANSNIVARVVYTTLSDTGSLTRYPNMNGPFVPQSTVSTNLASPGKQYDGKPFSEPAVSTATPIQLSIARSPGASLTLSWKADAGRAYSVLSSAIVTGPYTVVVSNVITGQFSITPAPGARFYKVSAP